MFGFDEIFRRVSAVMRTNGSFAAYKTSAGTAMQSITCAAEARS
jgi:hypothetical protein